MKFLKTEPYHISITPKAIGHIGPAQTAHLIEPTAQPSLPSLRQPFDYLSRSVLLEGITPVWLHHRTAVGWMIARCLLFKRLYIRLWDWNCSVWLLEHHFVGLERWEVLEIWSLWSESGIKVVIYVNLYRFIEDIFNGLLLLGFSDSFLGVELLVVIIVVSLNKWRIRFILQKR
jgi:hypothetical protein